MAMIRTTGARRGMLPMAVLGVWGMLAAGCGTHRPEGGAGAAESSRAAAAATPSRPADFPCPGESPSPAPTHSSGHTAPPADHYAENHGFRVPFPLHGQRRCDGLAAVRRIENALEPLRKRADFDPGSTRSALTGLGYSAGRVQSHQNGPAAVSFLIDASPLCLEGTMNSRATEADAFGGYPDHSGCDVPSGGH
ncbi:hypothetical protein [Streptomyces lydicus]|uniref:hypothetical protein n=1 Tax=Streptomyces lydicus TaxID=47763 RepID=UPI0013E99DA5|nr:hypothetical protein [Streptomyces lydicus]